MAPALGKRPRSAGVQTSGKTCVHGRREGGYFCKECPGRGICEHGRVRSKCKECGGGSICEHGRQRYRCEECVRSSRIRVGAVEAPTEAKVEIKEEPEDVEDPGEKDDSL